MTEHEHRVCACGTVLSIYNKKNVCALCSAKHDTAIELQDRKVTIADGTIGSRIRAKREQLGMSRTDFAFALKITYPTLNNIENNVSNPTLNKFAEIARLLDTTMDYLYTGKKHG